MKLLKSTAELKAECGMPVRVFAWLPVNVEDGSVVWLERVWRVKVWREVCLPYSSRFRVDYYREKP